MIGEGGEGIAMETDGALGEALERWSEQPRRDEGSKAARAHALHNFSEEAVMEQLFAIYREVLA